MKTTQFLIFLTVVLVVYGAVNFYIFIRGFQAIPPGSGWRPWFSLIFWGLASTFILARILERAYPSLLSGIVTWIGSFWLGFMLFFFLSVVLIDLLRLLNSFLHFFPLWIYTDPLQTRLTILFIILGLASLLVAVSFLNARIPRVKELNLVISKPKAVPRDLVIVMASDIHLGTIIASRKANRLVKTINSLHPDLVLFAGDIVDEDLTPVIRNDLGGALSRIEAPLGVYGITGNHEYIGGVEAAVKYLEDHGIRMLRDTAVLIQNRFYLVGRDDRDKPRFTGKPRKEIEELLGDLDTGYPVILMDHQPFNLAHHSQLGIDLQLSGHTHDGQLWPLTYLIDAIYEVGWGYKKISDTHFYVSSGFGTWGPPLRLGNRPEILKINVKFTN